MKRRRHVNARRALRPPARLVFGIHPVGEHVSRHAADVREVWLSPPLSAARAQIAQRAHEAGIAVHNVAPAQLDEICGHAQHQGAAAALREFVYGNLEELASSKPDLLIAADGVEDPRNLGALVRSVAAAGAAGLIIPRDRAAQVTPVAEKAAAGVTAWFPIVRVVNLPRTLGQLKSEFGFWITALAHDAQQEIYDADLPQPVVLVVGGEGGIRPLVRRSCDIFVRIPMSGGVESLNVAVAAAVGCFELRRRALKRAPGGC